jgi:hypothetical protein
VYCKKKYEETMLQESSVGKFEKTSSFLASAKRQRSSDLALKAVAEPKRFLAGPAIQDNPTKVSAPKCPPALNEASGADIRQGGHCACYVLWVRAQEGTRDKSVWSIHL